MNTDPEKSPSQSVEEVLKYRNSQLKVGAALAVFVLVAVSAAFAPFGSADARMIAVCLAVVVNVSLVAGVSMHLKSEKKTITQFLVFTVAFVIVLFALTALAHFDSTAYRH